MDKKTVVAAAMLGMLTFSVSAHGPLNVADDGTPAKWEGAAPTVAIVSEGGDCGNLSNTEMLDLISDLFSAWTDVAQSRLTVDVVDEPLINEIGQEVSGDINGSNYTTVLGIDDDTLSNTLAESEQNPMIWDNNCTIISTLPGASCLTALGVAIPYIDTENNAIVRSEEIINCRLNTVSNTLQATLIHELGHGLGCDHSQANQEEAENSDTGDNTIVPLMFPTAVTAGDDPTELQEDDELCLATLYPESSLTSDFWTLEGNLLDADGNGIPCANMTLENLSDDSETEITFVTATAAVFADTGDSSPTADDCEEDCGAFTFQGLDVDATYRLSVEPVDPVFIIGSSIGRCTDETNENVPTTTFSETFSVSSVSTETATITCNDSSCASPAISRTNTAGGGSGTDDDSSSGSCSLSDWY